MKHWILFSFLTLMFTNVRAQEASDSVVALIKIETNDDNTFIGTIVSENDQYLILRTSNFGDLTISKKMIVKRTPVEIKQGAVNDIWFENPHATRYFFSPNGYGLKTGEAYYQNTWVLFNQLSVGINDYFSMGVGTVPFFLLTNEVETPVWVTPKVSIPIKKDKINIGAGAMIGTLFGTRNEKTAGVFYGVGTFGSKDRNFTIGLGYAFGQYGLSSSPTVNLSGILRMSPKLYFITENYIIGDDGYYINFVSFGLRSVGKTMAIDFALVRPVSIGGGGSIFIPWLGVNIPFGRVAAQ